ncbi:phytanoyl-CoA dioxygenase family protein [Streptomyces sp. NRRL B-1381]|uniref:phytanoyl-CoA dioxygenase family protein n=1 Tax=Streptomyces sp. NRRL B-1381 TaxID=1463829 RepID=UPI00067B9F28|nr:phytanoyl-CoA dioxygenase family protein [Streptomyces sp. NRRL B-1381]
MTVPGQDRAIDDALAALHEEGCVVLPDVLDHGELREIADRLNGVAESERKDGTAWFSNGNQRVFNLLNRGQGFVDLIDHPVALALVKGVLGADALLSSITANIAQPGNVPQLLHTDQQYVQAPWFHPLTLNVVWMLDDFTPENGGTRYVPRSHVVGAPPLTEEIATVPLVGRAGGIALIDGRVWHGTGVNRLACEARRGIFAYYCAPYLRQQENVHRSLREEVRSGLSAEQQRLLGYDVWQGLGVVDGIPRHWMGTNRRSGPLDATGDLP